MKSIGKIMIFLMRGEKQAFAQGLALSFTVLVMGVALLALSGWFITAAAAAGMVGLGAVFNVFVPSALVRFLALGRTIARYGERLTTHDATLRALSRLRVQLLGGVLTSPYRQLERLRASVFLNRVTADVDALDGMALRLVLPALAGAGVIGVSAMVVGLLVHPSLAMVILVGYGIGPTAIFLVGQRQAKRPARRAEAGMQSLRSRVIDLIAVREDLIAFGQMRNTADSITKAVDYQSRGQAEVEQIERQTGFWLEVMGWLVVSACFGLGATLAQSGSITAAQAAIGVFAGLALSEAVSPVRRALSEIGRMRSAATRVSPLLAQTNPMQDADPPQTTKAALAATTLEATRGTGGASLFEPLSFSVSPGETVALTGRSGCGKSTVLLMAAGQIAPHCGDIAFGGTAPRDIAPDRLMQLVAMVPQRHALVAGTIAENLRLAAPTASDSELWSVLDAAQLGETVDAKGGLDLRLGFRGAGLSGGEARRLVIARALLRKPRLLLLDEPTEGLDAGLAIWVLNGIRGVLPDAAILMAAHRAEETAFADRLVPVRAPALQPAK